MSLEIEILNALINSYEKSKVSKGQNKVRKDIKLDVTHSVFDKHRNNDNGELEIAIQRIERDGFAKACYTRNGQFQRFILNLDEESIDRLYKYLKRTNPKNVINKFREAFINQLSGCLIVQNFSTKMIELLDEKKLQTVQQYAASESDIFDICKAINAMSELEEDIQERIFCAKLFSDSKRFNDLRGKITKIIREFSDEPFNDEEDVIATLGVIKNTAYAFIKGDLIIRINNQVIDLQKYGEPLALSDSAIESIKIDSVRATNMFTIENLTSFDVFKQNNSIIIYLGGFHNRVKRELIKKVKHAATNLNCYHYGDIDAGGFYILNHLRKKTGIHFMPYMMTIEDLKKHKNNCKTLTNNDKKRLNVMLNNDDFLEFRDVIVYMLDNNIKLEQEAEI